MGKIKKRFVDKEDEVSIHRACKYIGSFAINMMKSEERQTLMNERLEELKTVKKGIPVVLQVTTSGLKVLDENERGVKMAHSIMRIAFSTCSVDSKLFSYVAKSSVTSQNPSILQAHVFKTKKGSHAQQLSQLVSKAFKIAYAMATIKRNSRVDMFESNAKLMKQTSIEVKRSWAKKEIARGHEYAEHAKHARRLHPHAMLPGPADPIDREIFHINEQSRPRNVSNVDFDNRRILQGAQGGSSASQRLVDAQINTGASVKDTTPQEHQRGMSPVIEIQPDLSNEVSSTDCVEENTAKDPDQDQRTTLAGGGVIEATPQASPHVQGENLPQTVVENSQNGQRIGPDAQKGYTPTREDIYENVDITVNTQDKYIVQNAHATEEVYINKMTSAAPEHLYQPLDQSLGTAQMAVGHSADRPSSSAELAITGVEDVTENTVKSDEDSGDDDLYLNVGDLKPGGYRLTPSDQAVLEDSYWYQPGLPRDIAEEMLLIAMTGTFFIRDSTSNPGSFALSVRVPTTVKESGIANILIERGPDGNFSMPGLNKSFQSLPLLVAYYASFKGDLPVQLRLTYDEDTSVTGSHIDFVDGAPANGNGAAANSNEIVANNNVAAPNNSDVISSNREVTYEVVSNGGVTDAISPEEEAIAMIDAILPNDPDFAIYDNCEPILNELHSQ